MKNVTLKQFVEAVQTQSGYSFLYKDNQLKTNQRITVSVNKQSINVALEQAFKGKGISWKIQGKQILLFPAKEEQSVNTKKSRTIKGNVTTTTGESIPGASVKLANHYLFQTGSSFFQRDINSSLIAHFDIPGLTFTIRGIGTFTGNTSPLVIVDGVQRDDVNSTYGGAYNNIDPEDIVSISLLKDASATAVYGAKGANGVMIITTKRGSVGKPKISIKAETGFTNFTKVPEMLSGVDYMMLYNESRRNSGLSEVYSREQILKTESGLDPYLYPNVDWIDKIYKNVSSVSNVNLNISGGSDLVRYYLSASFYNQGGQYNVKKENGYDPNLNYKRYDFRSNVDVNITKTTLLQMNLSAIMTDSRYPGIASNKLWYEAFSTSPVAFPVRYPDGRWAGPPANAGSNPMNFLPYRYVHNKVHQNLP